METYTWLRTFADSWHLLFMTLFFIGVVIWAFRPGSRGTHDEIAQSIFRNDDRPGDGASRRAGPKAAETAGIKESL
ncbi:MAG: cbb3-type cytochrome oxidase subunit 3 [Gemmobacter sp.]